MPLPSQLPAPLASEPERVDRYRIIETLQANPPIRTCLGKDDETGSEAIILLLLPTQRGNDAELQQDFRRATRIALQVSERLAHPAIVRVLARGFSHGRPYVAQEHASGLTLADCLESGIVFHVDKIVDIFAQVADALSHAHDRKVVHGDIQPHHIILSRTGRVRVRNFGFAPALRLATDSPARQGFTAPELRDPACPPDALSDIHAFGASLYTVLTGLSPAHPGPTSDTLTATTMPPSMFNPDVSAALDALVLQAMHPERTRRPTNMRALAQALSALLPASLRPNPPAAGALRTAGDAGQGAGRRQRITTANRGARATLLGIGLAATLCAAVTGWLLLSDPPDDPESAPTAAVAPATINASTTPGPLAQANTAPELAAESAAAVAPPPADSTAPEAAGPPAPGDAIAPAAQATPPEKAPAPPAHVGRVTFNVSPWGEVRVNGQSRGATPPLKVLELPEGTHRIEIRNADFPPRLASVTIQKGSAVVIRHRFQ